MTKPVAGKDFKQRLGEYKQLIDADIDQYSKHVQQVTLQQYGANARLEVDAFLSILARGGKRFRGALAMVAYEMSGGTNQKMIIQAARALELVHAYMLVIDDIQDRSLIRRGGPAAHAILTEYHKEHELAGDSQHFGIAVGMMSGMWGGHAAQIVLSGLDVDPQLRLNAISIVNQTIITTAHGQTNDVMNEMVADVTEEDIRKTLRWKSAEYTFLNPLCVGMVLAGADCHATDAIREYALAAGMAFQIGDDILGTFGTEFESGKSPVDDMREGKRTLLVAYALQHAVDTDKNFLLQMLGNEHITPAQFERCKDILVQTGALEYARTETNNYIQTALQQLQLEGHRWSPGGVRFLEDIAKYMLDRNA